MGLLGYWARLQDADLPRPSLMHKLDMLAMAEGVSPVAVHFLTIMNIKRWLMLIANMEKFIIDF